MTRSFPAQTTRAAALAAICLVTAAAQPVHFDANLIQVDAVVRGERNAYIRDLKAEDFRVLQDGKSRKVASVTYEDSAPRTIVFLINDANMLPTNMVRVRESLTRFAGDQLRPTDHVAILTAMGGAGYLRQFTPPGPALQAAIDDLRWQPEVSSGLVVSRNIEVLRRAVVALADFPGRKSLIVVSNDMLAPGFDLRSIGDAASRASVVVYTVNPRAADFQTNTSESFLPALSAVTGGMVHNGGVDLDAALRAVMDDQAGYYLIGWDPGPALRQIWGWAVYHRVEIKANRPGLIVRSRSGFFGSAGPLEQTASSSQANQILIGLYAPFKPQQLPVRVTPFLERGENETLIRSLIHVGGGIDLAPDKDGCYLASLTVYSSVVPLGVSDDHPLATRAARLRVCGETAASVRDKGLICVIQDRAPGAGAYQVYVGVRNGVPQKEPGVSARSQTLIRRADWKQEAAQIGTANEFVVVPAGAPPPPLLLRGSRALVPVAGTPSQLQFRTLGNQADVAVRNFHSGDTLTYNASPTAKILILRDGEPIDSGEATGSYRLPDSFKPGQYVLAVTTAGQEQWTDFRILN